MVKVHSTDELKNFKEQHSASVCPKGGSPGKRNHTGIVHLERQKKGRKGKIRSRKGEIGGQIVTKSSPNRAQEPSELLKKTESVNSIERGGWEQMGLWRKRNLSLTRHNHDADAKITYELFRGREQSSEDSFNCTESQT